MKVKIRIKSIGGPDGVVTTTIRLRGGRGPAARRERGSASGGSAQDEGPVTPAMRTEAVRVFLAQGDQARLGRALAKVYAAMERVRLTRPGGDG